MTAYDGKVTVLLPADAVYAMRVKAAVEGTKLSRVGRTLLLEWLADPAHPVEEVDTNN